MKNKISENQLEKLKEFNQFMINASATLGDLQLQYESKKAQIINDIGDNQKKFNELKGELEKEFGNVEINLTTGDIIVPEENDGH
jgi:uncharacterized protein YgiM (DUF1202 family)